MTYSGSHAALMSSMMKFPLLLFAVAVFSSPGNIGPTVRAAFKESPFALWWVGLLYAAQNLLYFVCLQYISAAAYQILSQSKMIFTALFMFQLLGKRFALRQLVAVILLVVGTVATQLAEIKGPVVEGAQPWMGAALTLLSALFSALPNVFYERLLKEDKNQWVSNVQLTAWTLLWVSILSWCEGGASVSLQSLGHFACAVSEFKPLVWVIILLKALNVILVPACLKYGDNIIYGYAKPLSIVLTCAVTAAASSTMPSPLMLTGVLLVVVSILTYGKG
eukprot:CAMPEP_0181521512 /NCGR_PEP_ID=MMETSP1110-20121109/66878_1 /TAXON_ID=174948 /ORGANISM="Symbiodinium sp., Strain CCMP421" /LENGTH=277 /DNA_ID=CAMNT_0023652063 /DNA_START=352 /DNA_END=1185 /DNA_ORIENTATION=-